MLKFLRTFSNLASDLVKKFDPSPHRLQHDQNLCRVITFFHANIGSICLIVKVKVSFERGREA